MKIKDVIHLLILCNSQNIAEELINLFRNNGYPIRAHRLSSAEDLQDLLGKEPWDLLIGDRQLPELSPEQAAEILKQAGEDIPCLLISEDSNADRPTALEAGLEEVIAQGDQAHLLHAALRAIGNRRTRQDVSGVRSELKELQARYELLMGGSNDAIAYITDGMHIDVNEAYARKFGYVDTDEMASQPVIDLIADADQEKFKRFLRDYTRNDQSEAKLEITAQNQNGEVSPVQMIFTPASYEGEACTQIVIRAASASSPDRNQLFAEIALVSAQMRSSEQAAGALIYLQVENLAQLRNLVGVMAAEDAVNQVQHLLAEHQAADSVSLRLTADSYALLIPACKVDSALDEAQALLARIRNHIVEIGNLSVHCECSAAVIAVNDKSADSLEKLIDQAYTGVHEQLELGQTQFASIYTPPAAPIKIGSKDIDLDALYERGSLKLSYQPVVSLRGDPGEYYEISIRIEDDNGNSLDPTALAAGMYDGGKGSLYDRWLIFTATKQLAQKRAQGSDTRIILNLSPSALQDGELINWLGVSLNAAGIPAEAIAFSLSQADSMVALKQVARFFAELKNLGCVPGLSQFGETDDAEHVLQHAEARLIKICARAVTDSHNDESSRQKLKHLLRAVSEAGAASIVPDVCSAATLATLWQLGASYIQGEYLQEAAPAMDYEFSEIA